MCKMELGIIVGYPVKEKSWDTHSVVNTQDSDSFIWAKYNFK